jgi:hypothetical protein
MFRSAIVRSLITKLFTVVSIRAQCGEHYDSDGGYVGYQGLVVRKGCLVVELVSRLADESAIRSIHVRYCRGVDRRDWDLVRSCYHEDAVEDHGRFSGRASEFVSWAASQMSPDEPTTHFVGNQSIEIDGSLAWCESYTRACHRRSASDGWPAGDWILNLRYVDRLERRDDVWRIANRLVICDSERLDPVGYDPGLAPNRDRGRRDSVDPSYDRTKPPNPIS